MAPIFLAALALVMMPTIGALPVKPARAAFLGISLQPEKIARLLAGVQDEWKLLFASCDAVDNSTSAEFKFGGVPRTEFHFHSTVDCRRAPIAFAKSCKTVVQAFTEGSSGDRDVVEEYMKDICAQDVLKGWRQNRCTLLSNTIVGAMSFKTWAKDGVVIDKKKDKVCADIWSQFSSDEQVQRDSDRKQAAAKALEDAERKAVATAKAEQKAEDEAKAEADLFRQAQEAGKAKAKADEAKAKAEAEEAAKAKAKAEDAGANPVEAGLKTELKTEAKTELEPKTDLKTVLKIESKTELEPKTDVKTEIDKAALKAVLKIEAKARAAKMVKARADARAKAHNEAATKATAAYKQGPPGGGPVATSLWRFGHDTGGK